MINHRIRSGRKGKSCAAIATMAACGFVVSPAFSYSYNGPLVERAFGCVSPGQVAGYSQTQNYGNFGVMVALQTYVNMNPVGGAAGTDPIVNITGDQLTPLMGHPFRVRFLLWSGLHSYIAVERQIGIGGLDVFPISYGTYDYALSTRKPLNRKTLIDARIFMTEHFTWVETRSGPSDLAKTTVTPLFFGYGADIDYYLSLNSLIHFQPYSADSDCVRMRFARFDYADLQKNIQARYSKARAFPFYEYGSRAAALASAL